MAEDIEGDVDLLMRMAEGIMQTQELVVRRLVSEGVIDAAALKVDLEAAANVKDLRIGTQFPLLRMMDVVAGREPQPPRWTPRLIPGGKKS